MINKILDNIIIQQGQYFELINENTISIVDKKGYKYNIFKNKNTYTLRIHNKKNKWITVTKEHINNKLESVYNLALGEINKYKLTEEDNLLTDIVNTHEKAEEVTEPKIMEGKTN